MIGRPFDLLRVQLPTCGCGGCGGFGEGMEGIELQTHLRGPHGPHHWGAPGRGGRQPTHAGIGRGGSWLSACCRAAAIRPLSSLITIEP